MTFNLSSEQIGQFYQCYGWHDWIIDDEEEDEVEIVEDGDLMSIGAVAQRFQWKWQYDHDDDKHGTDRDKPAVEIVDNYATNSNCAIW